MDDAREPGTAGDRANAGGEPPRPAVDAPPAARPSPFAELGRFVRAALLEPVAPSPADPPDVVRRRRVVVVATLVAGAACLAWALRLAPGDPTFPAATLVLAALWAGGALVSGPLHLGRAHTRSGGSEGRGIVQSLALGALLLGVFLLGAVLVARVPLLRDPVQALLDHARYGPLALIAVVTAVNGLAEELFFRGALFAALAPGRAVVGAALASALATVASGVPLLVLAALVLGLVTGAQRRVTGGVLGPMVTHVTWSLGMLFLLPIALTAGS
ncbi:MAG: CPBP family intramembrane metalloprotease [Propionicimonas sp.]|uniref:CPBP family intramembrane glutamic endopeptidase n=1 Tax=Propionicimonas sp. TaxID=1955623 RepID=UPI003D1009DA